jgi:Insertion element 4 transposase N-terminal
MPLQEAFSSLPEVVPAELDKFRRHLDPVWVEEALMATGRATVRRRRLPAEQVLWLVIGMALMRNESLDRVVAWLDLALPGGGGGPVAKSAIAQARQRLGEDPVAYLFVVTAARWAIESAARHRWRGLSLFGLDGSTLRVPDSPENWTMGCATAARTRRFACSASWPCARTYWRRSCSMSTAQARQHWRRICGTSYRTTR